MVNQNGTDTAPYTISSPFAMRSNSSTGFVKWTKTFYVKNMTGSYSYTGFEISSSQVAWLLLLNSGTPYVYRISDNGTILQIIWFGSFNLNFAPTVAFMSLISETDFLFVQDLSLFNGKMSVSPASGTDYSIARISTDLSLK